MFSKKIITSLSLACFSCLVLSSCSARATVTETEDVAFCYLSDAYISPDMQNWNCYANMLYFNGTKKDNVVGLKHVPNSDIENIDNSLNGRLYSFATRTTLEGVSFGIGYLSGEKILIPGQSPIIQNEDNVFFLSITKGSYLYNYSQSHWGKLSLDTASFASYVLSYFNPLADDAFGYNCYPTLKKLFLDNLTDYSDDLAKSIFWDDKFTGTQVNLYDQLKIMKSNYTHHQKNNHLVPYIISFICGIMLLISLLVLLILLLLRRKHVIR